MVLRVVQRYHSDSVPQLTTPRANGQGWNVCYTQQNVLHPQPFKLNRALTTDPTPGSILPKHTHTHIPCTESNVLPHTISTKKSVLHRIHGIGIFTILVYHK